MCFGCGTEKVTPLDMDAHDFVITSKSGGKHTVLP